MSAMYPLSIHRRMERQWAARIKALKLINSKIAVAAERVLEGGLSGERVLIRVKVADRRRLVGDNSRLLNFRTTAARMIPRGEPCGFGDTIVR